eukprot:10399937-Karenia_brevis.AAC.1
MKAVFADGGRRTADVEWRTLSRWTCVEADVRRPAPLSAAQHRTSSPRIGGNRRSGTTTKC